MGCQQNKQHNCNRAERWQRPEGRDPRMRKLLVELKKNQENTLIFLLFIHLKGLSWAEQAILKHFEH